jgi:hypothetical protein
MEDNRKTKPVRRRPGPGIFLDAYSYIPVTRFDKRHMIPKDWVASSFNEMRQYREFFKTFIYPYPIPEVLLKGSIRKEYFIDDENKKRRSPDYETVKLLKRWVCNIVSGESFYKRNKKYFTKTEAHWFLSTNLSYGSLTSITDRAFYAKCRARHTDYKLSCIVASTLAQKFTIMYACEHPIVNEFIDLIVRTVNYRFDANVICDISDFILQKERDDRTFSMAGRTIVSLIGLVNEWHRDLQRVQEAHNAVRPQKDGEPDKKLKLDRWNGMSISDFQYSQDNLTWTVSELRTSKALLNEGRKMKNCVSSYAYECATGESSIFDVSVFYGLNNLTENVATLEVDIKSRALIQARGKCNGNVPSKVVNVITRWAQANRIKMKVL